MRKIVIAIALMWDRLMRSIWNATDTLFSSFGAQVDKVISKEQEVPELTTQEKFRFYTGVLGYHQQQARAAGDEKTVEAIEDDLWEMADAYKKGKLEEYLHNKKKVTTEFDIQFDEDTGDVKVIKTNLKNGKTEEIETGVAG